MDKLLVVLLNSQVHGQTDQGDADGSQGHDGGLGAGHEQLAHDDVQTAGDGQDGDQGVAGNLVLALSVGHLLTQHDDTVEGQGVEDPAGEHSQVGQQVELANQGVQSGQEADQDDGVGGNQVGIQLAQNIAEGQGLGVSQMEGNTGTGHQEAVGSADNGDDDADLDQGAAHGSEDSHGNSGSGGGDVHQLVSGDDPQVSHVDDEVDSHDDGNTADDSAGHILAGVLHLTGDGADVGPAFESEQNSQQGGTQNSTGTLALSDHGGEDGVLTGAQDEAEDHQQEQGDQLADGGNDLDAGSSLGTQGVGSHQQDDQCNGDGQLKLCAQVDAQLFADGNAVASQECGIEDDGLHPAGQEADLLTEGITEVSDHAAGLGDHDSHFCEGQSAQQGSDTAEDPGQHTHTGCAAGGAVDCVGLEENTGADNTADNDGHCCGNAKLLLHLSIIGHRKNLTFRKFVSIMRLL